MKGRICGEIGPQIFFIFMIISENGNSCRFMSLPYLCNKYCWLVRAELSRWWCLVIIGRIGFRTQRDSHFTGEQAEVEWFNQIKRIEKSVFHRFFFIAIFFHDFEVSKMYLMVWFRISKILHFAFKKKKKKYEVHNLLTWRTTELKPSSCGLNSHLSNIAQIWNLTANMPFQSHSHETGRPCQILNACLHNVHILRLKYLQFGLSRFKNLIHLRNFLANIKIGFLDPPSFERIGRDGGLVHSHALYRSTLLWK